MNETKPTMSPHLLHMSTEIVSAYVSNNVVQPEGIPELINAVHGTLGRLRGGEAPQEELTPAVSIRSAVKKDAIVCLDCGRRFKMLKRHLRADHDMDPTQYRSRWGLRPDYPMVAPDYSADRSAMAKKIGLGRKRKTTRRQPKAA